MKKYLTLAVLLGAIAFVSLSYLAQAETEGMAAPAAATETPAAPAADAMAPAAVAPVADYAKDSAECDVLASAPGTEGAAPADDAKQAAFKKCMMDKKHTEEEIAKEEALKKALTAPAAVEAPAAPAPAPEAK